MFEKASVPQIIENGVEYVSVAPQVHQHTVVVKTV